MAKKNRSFSFDQDQTSTINDLVTIDFSKEEPVDNSFIVKVTHPSLRIRRAPNASAEVVGRITDQGKYKIIDQVNGWGKLESGNWIMLSYTEIVH